MKKNKIIYMGTPEFSAFILEGLLKEGWNIIALVSQPDRPIGRKQIITPTPTKEIAIKYDLPVFQPEKIKVDYDFLKELNPDLILTCAYGQIVPQGVLDIPSLGCLNIHASLLPKLRGGAPIHRAIMNGESETGITLMQMIDKMDAGVMYAKGTTKIIDEDTYDSVAARLMQIGLDLANQNLASYIEGKLKGISQDESQVTFGWNIKREDEKIDFTKTSREVFNKIRGLNSWPTAYTTYRNEEIKILKSVVLSGSFDGTPGQILGFTKKEIIVKTGDGAIGVTELKFPGKNQMTAQAYLNGNNKLEISSKFE